MRRKLICCLVLFLLIPFSLGERTSGAISSTEELIENLPWLMPNDFQGQFSSRDRTGGNQDWSDERQPHVGYLYKDGDERVLAELRGQGEINRFWFTGVDNIERIRIYLDDRTNPTYDLTVQELFSGTIDPFRHPWVYDELTSSGGFVSMIPLAFEEYCKVTVLGTPLYYQIGYKLTQGGQRQALPMGKSSIIRNEVVIEPGQSLQLADLQGAGLITELSFTVPGISVTEAPKGIPAHDDGYAFVEHSEFVVKIDADNAGVRLVRRFDYGIGDQTANVYVDDQLVGTWSTPGTATGYRWMDASFDIPPAFTEGKDSIHIRIEFVSAQIDWNEFYYWIYSVVGNELFLTDTLDVGDTLQEIGHKYRIYGRKWSGTRDYEYPPMEEQPDPTFMETLGNLWLEFNWDQQPFNAVSTPFHLFFASPVGPHPVDSAVISVGNTATGDAEFRSLFPMPFGSNADLRLYNGKDEPVQLSYNIRFVEEPQIKEHLANGEIGHFYATYHQEKPTTPGRDYTVLKTDGYGKLVGVSMKLVGAGDCGYLEGDERICVDGLHTPSIYGTGTEDHFGGAWYFNRGPFTLPFYGAPSHSAIEGRYISSVYRFFLPDPVSFRSGISYTLEHGGLNDVPGDYESTVFWYGLAGNGLILSDRLLPGDETDRRAHHWQGKVEEFTLNSAFEGPVDRDFMTKTGTTGQETTSFKLRIESANQGVLLRRTSDQATAQEADINVDGAFVGTWFNPETNRNHRFADSDFFIPKAFTEGKTEITVEIVPKGPWTAFLYETHSLIKPEIDLVKPDAITDLVLDKQEGKLILRWSPSATAKSYRIYRALTPDFAPGPWLQVGQSYSSQWQGSPVPLADTEYYRVVAVSGFGVESAPSAAVEHMTDRTIWIEGEALQDINADAPFEIQGMDWVGPYWSKDKHLFFKPTKEGQWLEGTFHVPNTGTYEVAVYFTKAPDYGKINLLIDDQQIGEPWDGYAGGVLRSDRLVLGQIHLESGVHRLRLEAAGKNPSARGYFAGLDACELVLQN
ncbi:MAG: DUF2961 domain-containing protein [Limnochordia bacterium]|jgi:hypothetical protein